MEANSRTSVVNVILGNVAVGVMAAAGMGAVIALTGVLVVPCVLCD